MADYIEHVTKEGERWDQIAFKYYGDALAYEGIIVANPSVAIIPTLPGGITILVPILEQNTTSLQGLPPWLS